VYSQCRDVECAFGRLKSKFKILHRNTQYNDKDFTRVVEVCSALHNFLHREEGFEEEGAIMALAPHAREQDELQKYVEALPAVFRHRLEAHLHDREGERVREHLSKQLQIVEEKCLTKASQTRLAFAHYLHAN
jgi:hypothetical protein